MENEEKKTTKSKSESSRGGVHYDNQSKSWAFRAIRDGKDVRKKGFASVIWHRRFFLKQCQNPLSVGIT